eukprot:SAG25_NODE_656_length_6116_cov_8.686389_3_plen_228_part_00
MCEKSSCTTDHCRYRCFAAQSDHHAAACRTSPSATQPRPGADQFIGVDQRQWTAVRYDSISQNHGCTLRQHSAAVSLLKVPSQRTAVILADAAVRPAVSDQSIGSRAPGACRCVAELIGSTPATHSCEGEERCLHASLRQSIQACLAAPRDSYSPAAGRSQAAPKRRSQARPVCPRAHPRQGWMSLMRPCSGFAADRAGYSRCSASMISGRWRSWRPPTSIHTLWCN